MRIGAAATPPASTPSATWSSGRIRRAFGGSASGVATRTLADEYSPPRTPIRPPASPPENVVFVVSPPFRRRSVTGSSRSVPPTESYLYVSVAQSRKFASVRRLILAPLTCEFRISKYNLRVAFETEDVIFSRTVFVAHFSKTSAFVAVFDLDPSPTDEETDDGHSGAGAKSPTDSSE